MCWDCFKRTLRWMFYLHDFEPDASKWNLTVETSFEVLLLVLSTGYSPFITTRWSTDQHTNGGINIHLFPPTNPLRLGLLLPYKQSKRRVGSLGMHGEHDLYGFVNWEIFPGQAGKKNTPLILDSVFPKKSIFLEHVFFWGGISMDFFSGPTPPLIWDPLGPHTIPPRHSAWGSSDVPSPRWLFCGGYGFHGIKSGFLPGWCTKPRGIIFYKTMEAHFFNLLADYGLR